MTESQQLRLETELKQIHHGSCILWIPTQGTGVGPASPRTSLLRLRGCALCFPGAYPRDGNVEATRPTPVLSFPCSEPAAPSWAPWPLAMLPSKLGRE